CMQGLDFPLTV
nr:immunoglobulin light chain junction region [Macaca mulatta]